jgi:hypothetical protein
VSPTATAIADIAGAFAYVVAVVWIGSSIW